VDVVPAPGEQIPPIPNHWHGSDHLPIAVDVAWAPVPTAEYAEGVE
jgi:hypothetical protein